MKQNIIRRLSKLKKPQGFSLVECVVAIFVFAFMASILFVILASVAKTQLENRQNSVSIAEQVDQMIKERTKEIDGGFGTSDGTYCVQVYFSDGGASSDGQMWLVYSINVDDTVTPPLSHITGVSYHNYVVPDDADPAKDADMITRINGERADRQLWKADGDGYAQYPAPLPPIVDPNIIR